MWMCSEIFYSNENNTQKFIFPVVKGQNWVRSLICIHYFLSTSYILGSSWLDNTKYFVWLLCRLRSIAVQRDHFVWSMSVCPPVCPSVYPVVTLSWSSRKAVFRRRNMHSSECCHYVVLLSLVHIVHEAVIYNLVFIQCFNWWMSINI